MSHWDANEHRWVEDGHADRPAVRVDPTPAPLPEVAHWHRAPDGTLSCHSHADPDGIPEQDAAEESRRTSGPPEDRGDDVWAALHQSPDPPMSDEERERYASLRPEGL